MIKYTILYKNGKTWNGKAKWVEDIPAVDCLALVYQRGDRLYATTSYTCIASTTGYGWNLATPVGYNLVGYQRTPNPASVTKKQKKFDKDYARWVMDRTELVEYGYVDKVDTSIKAYKKWLWEQKLEKQAEDAHKSTLIPAGTKILIKFTSGKEEVYATVEGDSWFSLDTAGDIADYEVLDEQKQAGLKSVDVATSITFSEPVELPVNITINWDGIYKPWKEAAIKKYKTHSYDKPIKTTYTFWLGQDGSISDEM